MVLFSVICSTDLLLNSSYEDSLLFVCGKFWHKKYAEVNVNQILTLSPCLEWVKRGGHWTTTPSKLLAASEFTRRQLGSLLSVCGKFWHNKFVQGNVNKTLTQSLCLGVQRALSIHWKTKKWEGHWTTTTVRCFGVHTKTAAGLSASLGSDGSKRWRRRVFKEKLQYFTSTFFNGRFGLFTWLLTGY